MRRVGPAIIALGALCLAAPAHADTWRLGSDLELSPSLDASLDDAPALSFTPRVPGVFDLDDARVTLTYRPLREAGANVAAVGGSEGFAFGGALSLDRVVISGAIAQATLGLSEHERFDAAIEVGDLTTSMSYDEIAGPTGSNESRYALGADLATAPGLTVGAGLSYELSEDIGGEADTTGMVRFRLSF